MLKSFLALALFVSPAMAVDKEIKSRDLPVSTCGRFQIFQARVYPDVDMVFLIDSETGKTWRYQSVDDVLGWYQQVSYKLEPIPGYEKNENKKQDK